MTESERAAAIRWKNEEDVRIASMTWEQRKESTMREERFRITMKAIFFVGGFICGVGSFTEIMMLLGFGILGPIALHYDML